MKNKQETRLDKMFSESTRKRAILRAGGCERCGTGKFDIVKENGDTLPAWKQLQCCHCFGRAKRSTRWDEEDAAGLCGGCHMFIDAQHDHKEALFRKLIGDDRYELLELRANTPQKIDRDLVELYLIEKLKELE